MTLVIAGFQLVITRVETNHDPESAQAALERQQTRRVLEETGHQTLVNAVTQGVKWH